jgi:hypothetical protein
MNPQFFAGIIPATMRGNLLIDGVYGITHGEIYQIRKLCTARRLCRSGISDHSMRSLAVESAFSTKSKNAGGFALSIARCGVLGNILFHLATPIMFSTKVISAGEVDLCPPRLTKRPISAAAESPAHKSASLSLLLGQFLFCVLQDLRTNSYPPAKLFAQGAT